MKKIVSIILLVGIGGGIIFHTIENKVYATAVFLTYVFVLGVGKTLITRRIKEQKIWERFFSNMWNVLKLEHFTSSKEFYDYIYNDLPPIRQRIRTRHLQICPICKERLEEIKKWMSDENEKFKMKKQ
ncbi:hypothetical protein ACFL1Q_01095 [Patescibacteria group bacterium]